MSTKTHLGKSFWELLLQIFTGGFTLLGISLLISLNISPDFASRFNGITTAFAAALNCFAAFGMIYATIMVERTVNKLSIDARREDDYTYQIICYYEKLHDLYKYLDEHRFDGNRSVFDQNYDSDKSILEEAVRICRLLKYYVHKHPTFDNNKKESIKAALERIIKDNNALVNYELLLTELEKILDDTHLKS